MTRVVASPSAAWSLLLPLAVFKALFHLLAAGVLSWGYMTDELYFLDSTQRLDWGFVDHPPFSIALLAVIRSMAGDSIFAVRVVPALLAGAIVLLTGLMAREMGGGRAAQGLAALAVATSPVHLSMGMYYSMNPIDQALWALAAFVFLRIVNGAGARVWLLLGAVIGVGLLNKVSMSWFGFGLAVGLLLTPQRRWLLQPWPWAAAAIASACFIPFVWWQWQQGWPFLEFSRNAAEVKIGYVSPVDFTVSQILAANFLAAPLWIGGVVYGFASPKARSYLCVVWVFVVVFLLLAFSGSARPHYLAPAFPIAFAAGGVAAEALARRYTWLPGVAAAGMLLGGVFAAPLAMPILSPDATVRYQRNIALGPREEIERGGLLPMHLGLFFHAEAVLRPVAEVYESLTPAERERVEILTRSFGETGAINVLGCKRGLPPAIGLHNQYGLWGPGDASGELMIVVHNSEADLRQWFQTCERRRSIDCPYCMEQMQQSSVYLCRDVRRPLRELWPRMRYYG